MKNNDSLKHLKSICEEFNVSDAYELFYLHLKEDQKAIKKGYFEIGESSLLNNRIVAKLLTLNFKKLPEYEKEIVANILWLWHHHAATVCIWEKKELEQATYYIKKALEYQPKGHPNKMTGMMALLLDGDFEKAKEKAKNVDEEEKNYARYLLEEYKKGTFKK